MQRSQQLTDCIHTCNNPGCICTHRAPTFWVCICWPMDTQTRHGSGQMGPCSTGRLPITIQLQCICTTQEYATTHLQQYPASQNSNMVHNPVTASHPTYQHTRYATLSGCYRHTSLRPSAPARSALPSPCAHMQCIYHQQPAPPTSHVRHHMQERNASASAVIPLVIAVNICPAFQPSIASDTVSSALPTDSTT